MSEKKHVPFSNTMNDTIYNFKKKKQKVYLNIVDGKSFTDPLGMYTGVPMDEYDEPIQDADDL